VSSLYATLKTKRIAIAAEHNKNFKNYNMKANRKSAGSKMSYGKGGKMSYAKGGKLESDTKKPKGMKKMKYGGKMKK
jgi:hypothetical protein